MLKWIWFAWFWAGGLTRMTCWVSKIIGGWAGWGGWYCSFTILKIAWGACWFEIDWKSVWPWWLFSPGSWRLVEKIICGRTGATTFSDGNCFCVSNIAVTSPGICSLWCWCSFPSPFSSSFSKSSIISSPSSSSAFSKFAYWAAASRDRCVFSCAVRLEL